MHNHKLFNIIFNEYFNDFNKSVNNVDLNKLVTNIDINKSVTNVNDSKIYEQNIHNKLFDTYKFETFYSTCDKRIYYDDNLKSFINNLDREIDNNDRYIHIESINNDNKKKIDNKKQIDNNIKFYCRQCPRSYASPDGVRKHAKKKHFNWLKTIDKLNKKEGRKTRRYCIQY